MLSGHPRRFLLLFCGPRAAAAAVAAVFAAVHANNLVVISGEEEGEGQELGYHLRLWPDFEVSGEGGYLLYSRKSARIVFNCSGLLASLLLLWGLAATSPYSVLVCGREADWRRRERRCLRLLSANWMFSYALLSACAGVAGFYRLCNSVPAVEAAARAVARLQHVDDWSDPHLKSLSTRALLSLPNLLLGLVDVLFLLLVLVGFDVVINLFVEAGQINKDDDDMEEKKEDGEGKSCSLLGRCFRLRRHHQRPPQLQLQHVDYADPFAKEWEAEEEEAEAEEGDKKALVYVIDVQKP